MPNRRSQRDNQYRAGYLKSPAWFDRRDRWFKEETQRRGSVHCCICNGLGDKTTFELHHLEYTGVTEGPNGWVAGELHDDLVAAHPRCHEWIHRLIDRDDVLNSLMGRRSANLQAISRLRSRVIRQLSDWTDDES